MPTMKASPTAAAGMPADGIADHADFLAIQQFILGNTPAPAPAAEERPAAEEPRKDWRDPHSISSQLDDQTSKAIIQRLESRGKDAVFRSLFDTYFPQLIEGCSNVLEIGAGTGVICRALAARGFKGRLLGIDQSPTFIAAATEFARQEGYAPGQVDFKVCDARTLSREDLDGFEPDAIIMHTLISHVDDPLQTLRTARALARPGSLLVLVDGDYLGLHYHSSQNPELSETMSRALVEATFASPGVVRALPKLLGKSGWRLESASGKCVSELGKDFSYWKSFAEAYMPRVKGSGRVQADLVDAWWADQKSQAEEQMFLASCSYYTLFAKAAYFSEEDAYNTLFAKL